MSYPRPPEAAATLPAGVRVHAVVPAAGRGERFGGDVPKQFVVVGGRPLLSWTIDRLLAAGCTSVTVALPEEALATAAERLGNEPAVRFVAGGASRQASVAAALAASPAGPDELVAVHDGARAGTAPADFSAAVHAAAVAGGAVLGRPATDTMKEVEGGAILRTLDRARLFRAETPQIFRRELLERALAAARRDRFVGTDEASLVERLDGVEIRAVAAIRPNPKVTFAADLPRVAELLLGEPVR
jgi:2-C-methyl-D-erythritol 4-phosphate cytidylyltransferase